MLMLSLSPFDFLTGVLCGFLDALFFCPRFSLDFDALNGNLSWKRDLLRWMIELGTCISDM